MIKHNRAYAFIQDLGGDQRVNSGIGLGITLAMEHPELAMALAKDLDKPTPEVPKTEQFGATLYALSSTLINVYLTENAFEALDD